MQRFVIGDIQGNYKGFIQCLERSKFDYDTDELIVLGDVCDGLPQTRECFDELLKIKKMVFVIGNHDEWLWEWIQGRHPGDIWTNQGGRNTQASYGNDSLNVPTSHIKLFKEAHIFYIDNDNRVFVHGGFDPNVPLYRQKLDTFIWDRELVRIARIKHNQKPEYKYGGYNEIFVGHTTTEYFGGGTEPLHYCNVWMLDTGGGWSGKITIMNIETKEYFQSDLTPTLYPGVMTRG